MLRKKNGAPAVTTRSTPDRTKLNAAISIERRLETQAKNPAAALAHEFIDRHGHEFRYVDQWGRWMRWTGIYWEHEATRLVHDLTARICRDSAQWFKDNSKSPPKDLGKFRTVSAVEMYARHERTVAATVKQWDEDEWLLNTAGGAVVFSNGDSK